MPLRNTTDRYGPVAQFLHWSVVALLLVQFSLAWIAHGLSPSPHKVAVLAIHKSFGITILGLASIRLLWRLANPVPALPPMPVWQSAASRVSHFSLYALLFAMPLSGWLMSSASNYPVSWFGLVQLPDFVRPDPDLKAQLRDFHHLMWKVLAGIAVVHVAAALKHQFVDRNDLMYRMLPWRPG